MGLCRNLDPDDLSEELNFKNAYASLPGETQMKNFVGTLPEVLFCVRDYEFCDCA